MTPGVLRIQDCTGGILRVTRAGWRPCPEGTPGASENLNRLTYFERAGHDGLCAAP